MTDGLVVPVRVKPGSRRAAVGGSRGDPPALVIAVRDPAENGRATRAAADSLAKALGVPVRDVTLVRGAKSREKWFRVAGDPVRLRRLVGLLLSPEADTPVSHDHE